MPQPREAQFLVKHFSMQCAAPRFAARDRLRDRLSCRGLDEPKLQRMCRVVGSDEPEIVADEYELTSAVQVEFIQPGLRLRHCVGVRQQHDPADGWKGRKE
jgi:hypothetical protein